MKPTLDQLLAMPERTFDEACKATGYNPTMFNCMPGKRLPDPSVYKVFEVRPCNEKAGSIASCEYAPEFATFWTVYGARDAEWTEWDAITDVSTEKLAYIVMGKLQYPMLLPFQRWAFVEWKRRPIIYESTVGGKPDLYQMWLDSHRDDDGNLQFHRIPVYEEPE